MEEFEKNDINRPKPLCYDPERDKFITEEDIKQGTEKIIPIESLSEDDFKKLVIARLQVTPNETIMQAISGIPYTSEDVIRAIEQNEEFGRMMLEAEKSYIIERIGDLKHTDK